MRERSSELSYPLGRMKRRCPSRLWPPLLCLAVVAVSLPVVAQQRPAAPETSPAAPLTEDQRKAQEHFQRAKELYQAGSYREAVAELEVARGLDPKAKDLVMNLGIVHEKLGKFDEAVGYFKSYLEMDVTPAERAKVEGMIKRIEGAKREVPAPTTQPTATSAPTTTAPTPAEPPPHGRIDGLTIAAGAVAAAGILAGTGIGIYAVSARPTNFVTGRDGSYATLQQKTDNAHTAAIIADVSLGVGIVAAVAAAWLYFSRTKDPVATTNSARSLNTPPKRSVRVLLGASSAPFGAGLGGSF